MFTTSTPNWIPHYTPNTALQPPQLKNTPPQGSDTRDDMRSRTASTAIVRIANTHVASALAPTLHVAHLANAKAESKALASQRRMNTGLR